VKIYSHTIVVKIFSEWILNLRTEKKTIALEVLAVYPMMNICCNSLLKNFTADVYDFLLMKPTLYPLCERLIVEYCDYGSERM
jgi:hypothetical protein